EMRRPHVDLLHHFRSCRVALKSRQWRNIGFLPCHGFKLFLLTLRFMFPPRPRPFTGNGFDPPNSSCDRLFLYNPKRPYFISRSHVCATAQLHGITIERARRTADLQDTNGIAVFLSEELDNVS